MQFYRHLPEVQFQRGTIVNRVLEGIFRHIASFILVCAKTLEGILIALIDRCTCQSKEEGIGQRQSHTLSEVSFLCAMGFVHQYDDILSGIQSLLHLTKQEDGGDQDLTLVFGEKLLQFFTRIGEIHILDL